MSLLYKLIKKSIWPPVCSLHIHILNTHFHEDGNWYSLWIMENEPKTQFPHMLDIDQVKQFYRQFIEKINQHGLKDSLRWCCIVNTILSLYNNKERSRMVFLLFVQSQKKSFNWTARMWSKVTGKGDCRVPSRKSSYFQSYSAHTFTLSEC